MRILTYNTLKCPAKDVVNGYPLKLEIIEFDIIESELNKTFLINIIPTLHWDCIIVAAEAIGLKDIPSVFDNELLKDQNFLLAMHNLLLDIHITKGFLVCPESDRRFPIENGIPVMM